VHVTLRAGLRSLRSQLLFPTVRYAVTMAGRRDGERFRIVHFSVQYDHVHLIVAAASKRTLSAGMRSLAIRIARHVNKLLMRSGPFWTDRWHGRALSSPSDVRNAVVYVLANFRKHARRPVTAGIDPCSSGAWFTHFRGFDPERDRPRYAARPPPLGAADLGVPVSAPRTWLLTAGLGRTAPIGIDEAPLAAPPPRVSPRRLSSHAWLHATRRPTRSSMPRAVARVAPRRVVPRRRLCASALPV
jgi:REP element-mobilizing transposase RayT